MTDEPANITPKQVETSCEDSKFSITIGLAHLSLIEEALPSDDLSLVRQLLATAIRQITAMHKRTVN